MGVTLLKSSITLPNIPLSTISCFYICIQSMIRFYLSIRTGDTHRRTGSQQGRIMRAPGEAILHPVATFSNVTCKRHRIKDKIFADFFGWDRSSDAAGERESDPLVVARRPTRSFRDATPYRSRVRREILGAVFKGNLSGGTGGGWGTSDGVVLCDSLLHCGEILAYLFKRGTMD